MQVIITSPSLDPAKNVSGISAVVQFVMDNNPGVSYLHFEQGRQDGEQGGLRRVITLLKSLKKWRTLLKSHPDDVIHYNLSLGWQSVLRDSIFLHFAKKHKTVIHVHGGNYLMVERKPLIFNKLLKRLFSKDVPFVVLSELEKEKLRHDYNVKNIHVLPNCPDLRHVTEEKPLTTPDHNIIMGYLGRICTDKGMPELLAACAELKAQNVDFTLKMAGSEVASDYVQQFQTLLKSQFEYLGVVSGQEKSAFLQSLDVFVLPSYYEGLPMSLLESMSFGVVPVCTNVGSIGEVVENNVNGLFVGTHSSQDIVNKIQELHADRKLLHTFSLQAAQTIREHFNPRKYIQTLNDLYVSLP